MFESTSKEHKPRYGGGPHGLGMHTLMIFFKNIFYSKIIK